jgi:hypothetical protein
VPLAVRNKPYLASQRLQRFIAQTATLVAEPAKLCVFPGSQKVLGPTFFFSVGGCQMLQNSGELKDEAICGSLTS